MAAQSYPKHPAKPVENPKPKEQHQPASKTVDLGHYNDAPKQKKAVSAAWSKSSQHPCLQITLSDGAVTSWPLAHMTSCDFFPDGTVQVTNAAHAIKVSAELAAPIMEKLKSYF